MSNSHSKMKIFTVNKPWKLGPGTTEGVKKNTFIVSSCRYCHKSKLAADGWRIPFNKLEHILKLFFSQSEFIKKYIIYIKNYLITWLFFWGIHQTASSCRTNSRSRCLNRKYIAFREAVMSSPGTSVWKYAANEIWTASGGWWNPDSRSSSSAKPLCRFIYTIRNFFFFFLNDF